MLVKASESVTDVKSWHEQNALSPIYMMLLGITIDFIPL